MVDISKFIEPNTGETNYDIGLMRRRLVSAIREVHLAIIRWKTALPDEQKHKLFVINAEIPDSDYPRLIVEHSGVSKTSCERHEFDSFEDMAEFLLNENTVGELP